MPCLQLRNFSNKSLQFRLCEWCKKSKNHRLEPNIGILFFSGPPPWIPNKIPTKGWPTKFCTWILVVSMNVTIATTCEGRGFFETKIQHRWNKKNLDLKSALIFGKSCNKKYLGDLFYIKMGGFLLRTLTSSRPCWCFQKVWRFSLNFWLKYVVINSNTLNSIPPLEEDFFSCIPCHYTVDGSEMRRSPVKFGSLSHY